MKRAVRMERNLISNLSPVRLLIEDESHMHAGHSGAPEGGESHYRLVVVSHAFEGVSRVDRQRMVYAALNEEFVSGLHALAVTALTPGQDVAIP